MTYEIRANETWNSNEVYFTDKPSEAVREALKALKLRWNRTKACWYGFATEHTIINAIREAEASDPETEAGTIITDGYLGGGAVYGPKSNTNLYGADLAKAFREDIKKAGLKGITVRAGKATYTDSFTFTVKVTESDVSSEKITSTELLGMLCKGGAYNGSRWVYVEEVGYDSNAPAFVQLREEVTEYRQKEALKGMSINHYYIDKYTEYTEAFRKKLQKLNEIIKAWNFDKSNGMVDYFDTNFYYTIQTKSK